MALLSHGGWSSGETISSASVRPAASATGIRSAPSGATAPRTRSSASRTDSQSACRRCRSPTGERLRPLAFLRRVHVEEQHLRVTVRADVVERDTLDHDVVVEPDHVDVATLDPPFDRGDAARGVIRAQRFDAARPVALGDDDIRAPRRALAERGEQPWTEERHVARDGEDAGPARLPGPEQGGVDAAERAEPRPRVGPHRQADRCEHVRIVRDQDDVRRYGPQRADDAVDDSDPAHRRQRLGAAVAHVAPAGEDRAERRQRVHGRGSVAGGQYTWASLSAARATIGNPAAAAMRNASVVGTEPLAIHATPHRAALRAISPVTRALSTSPMRPRSSPASNAAPIALSTALWPSTSSAR